MLNEKRYIYESYKYTFETHHPRLLGTFEDILSSNNPFNKYPVPEHYEDIITYLGQFENSISRRVSCSKNIETLN